MNTMALGAGPGGRALPPLVFADDARRPRWALLGVLASVALHLGAFAALASAPRPAPLAHAPRRVIEIETVARKPPPVPPAPEPAPEPPAPAKAPRAPKAAPRVASAPPPPPARAGRTLSAPAEADAVADFTMVQGAGSSYAGGVTSSAGTSKAPVTGVASDAGPPTAQPSRAPAGPAADLAQTAKPEGSDWDCSSLFPPDASVNLAHVTLAVRVGPDGRARSVSVLSDPGEGFGPAARACAMRQRYRPALDRAGNAVAAQTAPFRVRFTR